jgi:succinate dehydrogenase/fumarate reductase flavoprotein subunit
MSDWLGQPPVIADDDITETFEGDIIVLGGGNSGIQAALAAAEGGAKVHVIEQASEADRKVKGQDVGHVNSEWLISQGFGPYDESEIVDEFLKRCNGRNDPEIIKRFVYNSGEMFDHMIGLVAWPDERIRLAKFTDPAISPLDPSEMIVHQAGARLDGEAEYPIEQGGYKTWAATAEFPGALQHGPNLDGRAGSPSECSRLDEVQQFSILKGQELGAEWHYEQTAVVLLTDESGAVTGAISQNANGGYTRYNARRGVILCTGDFGGNVEMAWSVLGEISEWAQRAGVGPDDIKAFSNCQGEGHKMGCWAGGMLEPLPRPTMAFFMSGGTPWGTTPYLWLNSEGKRYMNEAATQLSWQLNLRQPLGALYTFTDSRWYDILKKAGVDHGSPNCGHTEYFTELVEDMDAVPLGSLEGGPCRSCTQTGRGYSTVYAADTLDELCDILGMDASTKAAALESIERYNELCATGKDEDYNKDDYLMQAIDTPPFYGCLGNNKRWDWVGLVSLTGLVTDGYQQVLNTDGRRIPGLWAAGNCLGGRYGNGYATPMAGNSIGMALTHGRVAGKVATGQEVR